MARRDPLRELGKRRIERVSVVDQVGLLRVPEAFGRRGAPDVPGALEYLEARLTDVPALALRHVANAIERVGSGKPGVEPRDGVAMTIASGLVELPVERA